MWAATGKNSRWCFCNTHVYPAVPAAQRIQRGPCWASNARSGHCTCPHERAREAIMPRCPLWVPYSSQCRQEANSPCKGRAWRQLPRGLALSHCRRHGGCPEVRRWTEGSPLKLYCCCLQGFLSFPGRGGFWKPVTLFLCLSAPPERAEPS